MLGRHLKTGDTVVFESTVYPGAIEEMCIPELESGSGLKAGADFKVGYSRERINAGDAEHTFSKVKKVVAAQDAEALERITAIYSSVVEAGVHPVSSIRVAEAAKVIENIQRDLNVALMNELAIVFQHLGIDTQEVLEAAATKWNFMKFSPGLVGGHCIGVDPYYLTHVAQKAGYTPQVILAGRQVNERMGEYVAQQCLQQMIGRGHRIPGARVTVLGVTFKENSSDTRNSKVVDLVGELRKNRVEVQIHDPRANAVQVETEYQFKLTPWENLEPSDAVIVAVAHSEY